MFSVDEKLLKSLEEKAVEDSHNNFLKPEMVAEYDGVYPPGFVITQGIIKTYKASEAIFFPPGYDPAEKEKRQVFLLAEIDDFVYGQCKHPRAHDFLANPEIIQPIIIKAMVQPHLEMAPVTVSDDFVVSHKGISLMYMSFMHEMDEEELKNKEDLKKLKQDWRPKFMFAPHLHGHGDLFALVDLYINFTDIEIKYEGSTSISKLLKYRHINLDFLK